MKLIVNLPAFNEEEKIVSTIKRIPRNVAGVDEVFVQVIDDGSKDKTAEKAREAGADFVFSHEVNRGIGVTFRTAVEKALENGADIMVNMDADGQFDPNDISKLIANPHWLGLHTLRIGAHTSTGETVFAAPAPSLRESIRKKNG